MQRRRAPHLVIGVAVATVAGILVTAGPAQAVNYCGTSQAGHFTNNSQSRSINVQGDTASGGYPTKLIAPGKTAASAGICDADFFAPRVPYYIYITTGTYEYHAANTYTKISGAPFGGGTVRCQDSGRSDYPIVCS